MVKPNYQGEGSVKIEAYRVSKFLAGGVQLYLIIDGDVVCGLWNGESSKFTISPGKHQIMLHGYNAIGKIGNHTFEKDKSYLIKIEANFQCGVYIITEK